MSVPIKPVILLIHDWGSLFGYHFYNQYPELVSKIISVDVGDWLTWQNNSSLYTRSLALLYQITLAFAWKINGRIGTFITRALAKFFKSPTPIEEISANMNYPYWYYWFGGENNYKRHFKHFNPKCPFLFFYGKDKPMMAHDQEWLLHQATKKGNYAMAFEEDHWLMKKNPNRFNEAVIGWLKYED